jgi:predicted site-specific integrase-resolvase
VNLAACGGRSGVARVLAYRWFHAGLLPVPGREVGRLILAGGLGAGAGPCLQAAACAGVSSADQKAGLDRQAVRVTARATGQQIPAGKVVAGVGSALNGRRRKVFGLLKDPAVRRVVVEHRDRFCRFGAGYVQAALAARGRGLVVAGGSEVAGDLVRDMTEILTSMCARPCGRRAAENRARRALAAAAGGGGAVADKAA